VAFKFRSKRESAAWRNRWDWVLCITGLVPALLFGVAVGNVILGVPFRLGDDMRIYYDGSFFGLLTVRAAVRPGVAVHAAHARCVLAGVQDRGRSRPARSQVRRAVCVLTTVLFAAAGVWLGSINGYVITSEINHIGPPTP
jgi:cytochrome d ubiquinol oxidase subunit II